MNILKLLTLTLTLSKLTVAQADMSSVAKFYGNYEVVETTSCFKYIDSSGDYEFKAGDLLRLTQSLTNDASTNGINLDLKRYDEADGWVQAIYRPGFYNINGGAKTYRMYADLGILKTRDLTTAIGNKLSHSTIMTYSSFTAPGASVSRETLTLIDKNTATFRQTRGDVASDCVMKLAKVSSQKINAKIEALKNR